MEEIKNIVFKRVDGVDYSVIKNDLKKFNIFLSVDGARSVNDIAQEDAYDPDYLLLEVDKMEKMGLVIPVDGAEKQESWSEFEEGFCSLPKEFLTGLEAVDHQHQRLVDMVTQLDDVRKASYPTMEKKQQAVGSIVSEMIDYTISHFAFEESLMEDAQYKFYSAHKRIHALLISRAGEYKERWVSGEDIADELYEVLSRWLFNHIRNDDKAFAPVVKEHLMAMGEADGGWLTKLINRFFR
jgi:hemerythrin